MNGLIADRSASLLAGGQVACVVGDVPRDGAVRHRVGGENTQAVGQEACNWDGLPGSASTEGMLVLNDAESTAQT